MIAEFLFLDCVLISLGGRAGGDGGGVHRMWGDGGQVALHRVGAGGRVVTEQRHVHGVALRNLRLNGHVPNR